MIRRRLAGVVVTTLLTPACFGGCTIEPGADCAGDDLTEEQLAGANLGGVNFAGANLSGVDLSGADLDNANLSGADLSGSTLTGAHLFMANLSEANLSGALVGNANLTSADLRGADLSSANLVGADLAAANLAGANLSGANMREAYGSEAKIPGSNLSDANMQDAEFPRADLSMADLSGATLSGADLFGADLSGADLTGASLRGANLEGAEGLTDQALADALGVEVTHLARALGDSRVLLESLDSMASELRLACTGRRPSGAGTSPSVGFHPVLDVLAKVRATPFADRLPEQFYPPALRFAQLVLCLETDPPIDLGRECGPYTDPQFPGGTGYDLSVKRERLTARIVDASTGKEIARRTFLGREQIDCPGFVNEFDVFVLNEVSADDLKAFVRPFVFAD